MILSVITYKISKSLKLQEEPFAQCRNFYYNDGYKTLKCAMDKNKTYEMCEKMHFHYVYHK